MLLHLLRHQTGSPPGTPIDRPQRGCSEQRKRERVRAAWPSGRQSVWDAQQSKRSHSACSHHGRVAAQDTDALRSALAFSLHGRCTRACIPPGPQVIQRAVVRQCPQACMRAEITHVLYRYTVHCRHNKDGSGGRHWIGTQGFWRQGRIWGRLWVGGDRKATGVRIAAPAVIQYMVL